MIKKTMPTIPTLLLTIMLILPSMSSAMTIDEYFYPDENMIDFVVHQTEGNIAGFAIASKSVNLYSGSYIDNAYADTWETFRIVKDGNNNWVHFDNNDESLNWLNGWGENEQYAFVFCERNLNGWWDFNQNGGTLPSDEDPLPELTYLTEETIGGWMITAGQPYSPFAAISIGEGANYTLIQDTTTEHVVPIPATALLLGSGLIGLVGYQRKRKALAPN